MTTLTPQSMPSGSQTSQQGTNIARRQASSGQWPKYRAKHKRPSHNEKGCIKQDGIDTL